MPQTHVPQTPTRAPHNLVDDVPDHYKYLDAFDNDEARFGYVTMDADVQGEDAGDTFERTPIPPLLPLLASPSLVLPIGGSPGLIVPVSFAPAPVPVLGIRRLRDKKTHPCVRFSDAEYEVAVAEPCPECAAGHPRKHPTYAKSRGGTPHPTRILKHVQINIIDNHAVPDRFGYKYALLFVNKYSHMLPSGPA